MTKKMTVLLLTAVLLLAGCSDNSSGSSSESTNASAKSASSAEAAGNAAREPNVFYIEEESEGYILMRSGDGRFTEQLDYEFKDNILYYSFTFTNDTDEKVYADPTHISVFPSFNNDEPCDQAIFTLQQVLVTFKAGETYQGDKCSYGLDGYIDHLDDKKKQDPDTKDVWYKDRDNEVWYAVMGSVYVYDGPDGRDYTAYTFPVLGEESCPCFSQRYDKDGNII